MREYETIADIVVEKRKRASEIERDIDESMASGKIVSLKFALMERKVSHG